MKIDTALIKKYNKPGPRYTSYPPANYFTEEFTRNDYIQMVRDSNNEWPSNISLYIHIPFCPRICHFCGCNTNPMPGKTEIAGYIHNVKKEIDLVAEHLDTTRQVTQIHWGGGTPNSLNLDYVEDIMHLIYSKFTLSHNPEIAMECSPAYLELDHIVRLANMGFNRMSLGIQDFNTDLLKRLNRIPAKYPIKDIYRTAKKAGFEGVNFDFVYGLPSQTLDDHIESIKKAIEIHPERIVTFSYAHVPWFKEHQKKLESYDIPQADTKLKMLESSFQLLTENGYVAIGMDHYAKPGDELSLALQNKTLHRNFQGYCTKEKTGQVYAFGATGISQLAGGYSQNTRKLGDYNQNLENNQLPVFRGYKLSRDEKIRRKVLNEIMCNHYLDFGAIARQFDITRGELKKVIEYNPGYLDEFATDGLLDYDEQIVKVTSRGFFLIRNIAMAFDPLMKSANENRYSKTI
ncbi:MAG: oxygen-independent coproporphyrinogen III oxidase [Bacteroidales bacterium]|nr:oxygen-independent coproporphyrinogen III oxidase [Bacteroidales bacterium]